MDETKLIDHWCTQKRNLHSCSEYTVYAYRLYLRRLHQYLSETDSSLISATAMQLADYAGHELHAHGLKPQSRRVCIAAMRGFYSWLKFARIRDDNPAAMLPAPKIGTRLPRSMPLASAERLLMQPGIKNFWALRDTAMIAILLGTGCRVSGLSRLNERDLLWTRGPNGSEQLTVRLCEKGKKERLVPVPMASALLIRAYLGHPQLADYNRTLPNGDQVLFVVQHNSRVPSHEFFGEAVRLGKAGVWWIVRKHCVNAAIASEFAHPHALRHLYGTELAEEDADLITRKILMGHSRIETVEVYSHLAMRKLAKVVDQANPMVKMRTPVDALVKRLRRPST